MCRVGRYGVKLHRKLPLPIFRDLLDELSGSLNLVRLIGLGESTLLPDFQQYAQLIIAHGFTLELITNGTGNLTDYQYILDNDGILLFSWDAAEKEIYERLRRPAKWELQVNQLKNIGKYAIANETSDKFYLLFTLQPSNIDQLTKIVEKAYEWNVENIIVNIAKLPNDSWIDGNFSDIKESLFASQQIAQENSISLMIPEQLGGRTLDGIDTLVTSSSNCTMPWTEAVIRWNGDVQVCNMFNPYTYGNLHFNNFTQIWNNSYAQIFRKNVNSDYRHPYCTNCVYMKDSYAHRHV